LEDKKGYSGVVKKSLLEGETAETSKRAKTIKSSKYLRCCHSRRGRSLNISQGALVNGEGRKASAIILRLSFNVGGGRGGESLAGGVKKDITTGTGGQYKFRLTKKKAWAA